MKTFHILCMVLMIVMMQHTCLAETKIIDLDNGKEWDAENQTITIFNESSKTKLMAVKLILTRPDLCTFTEIYEVRNFEAYTPNSKADFKARTNTVVGSGAVTYAEWFIEQNESYVVNVTDYGIRLVEKEVYNNKTGKNETVLVNRTVITGYHDETRYKITWIDYQPYVKEMKKDHVQKIKIVYHKVPELGPFQIQTVPMFRGVECPELTWWSGSWDRRRAILINNTIGDAVTDYQLVSVDLSPFGIDASSARIVNSTSGLQESFWNESVDASGNLERVYCDFSSIPTGAWINTTYYIYYQSVPSANSVSDGIATFEFFDDFNDGDLMGWSTQVSTAISSTQAKDGGYSVYIDDTSASTEGWLSRSDFDYQSGVLEYDWRRTTSSLACNLVLTDGGTIAYYHRMQGSAGYEIKFYDGAIKDYSLGAAAQAVDTWEKHSLAFDEPNAVMKAWLDNVYLGTGIRDNNVAAIDTIRFSSRWGAGTGAMGYIDRIRLRQYTANEPEPWTVGAEEEYTPTPTPTPAPTTSVSPAQYDVLDLPLILYILLISMLYLFIAFRIRAATIELSLIYLIFAFIFLLFQTVTMSVNYIYLTLFLLLFMISIVGITLKQGAD